MAQFTDRLIEPRAMPMKVSIKPATGRIVDGSSPKLAATATILPRYASQRSSHGIKLLRS